MVCNLTAWLAPTLVIAAEMSDPSINDLPGLIAVSAAAAVAILIALAALACALVFRIRMLIPTEVPDARVTLILPATGPLPGLADLLEGLRNQTLRPALLIIAVESPDDPAYARVAH